MPVIFLYVSNIVCSSKIYSSEYFVFAERASMSNISKIFTKKIALNPPDTHFCILTIRKVVTGCKHITRSSQTCKANKQQDFRKSMSNKAVKPQEFLILCKSHQVIFSDHTWHWKVMPIHKFRYMKSFLFSLS